MFDFIPGEKKKIVNSQEALSAFEKISIERKQAVKDGEVPDWYITQGYMLFNRKYAFGDESVRDAFTRTAKTLSRHYTPYPKLAEKKFFNLMWKGDLAPATPVLCNTGTGRGHSVSCSGTYVDDSIPDFYTSLRETAVLSQKGYGTSVYLGDIRPRGAPISTGGNASGVQPVLDNFVDMSSKISQGNNRRGQVAGYLPVMHPDFNEVWDFVFKNPNSVNIGWIYYDRDIDALNANCPEAVRRWNQILYLRSRYGKGYIIKPDTANRMAPEAIRRSGIPIVASNLCTEIFLPQNSEYSFSCVLSSLNLFNWFSFDADTIFWATIFLDCVVSETLEQAEGDKNIETIYNFTRDFRALGLGALGWHSLLQSLMLPFDSLKAKLLNKQIFARIQRDSIAASRHLAKELGEPKFCKGLGTRNATNNAIAPNTSSALLCGGRSQGIEPLVSNTYNQNTAAGEVTRMNPILIKYMKDEKIYSEELINDLELHHQGSVQHIPQMNSHAKRVFATAFEINQHVLIDQASDRQPNIDQGQSLNIFCAGDENHIARVSKRALNDPKVKSMYYQRSMRSVRASTGECVACEG